MQSCSERHLYRMKISYTLITLGLLLPYLELTSQENFHLQAQWFPVRQLLWETYPFLTPCFPDVAIVTDGKGRFNLVNERGERLCSTDHDHISLLNGNTTGRFFMAHDAGAYQVLDAKGRRVPLPTFQYCHYNASMDAFIVAQDGRYGLADTKGRLKLPFQYTKLWGDAHHIIMSTDGLHYGTISPKGKVRIPPRRCKEMLPLPFGFLSISNGEAKALLDSTGRQLCDFQFYDIWPLPSGEFYASLPESPQEFRLYDKNFRAPSDDIWTRTEGDDYFAFCLYQQDLCSVYRPDGSLAHQNVRYDADWRAEFSADNIRADKATSDWARKHHCSLLSNGCYAVGNGQVLGPDRKLLFEYKSEINFTSGGFFFVRGLDNKTTVLDIHGKPLTDSPYKTLRFEHTGILLVEGPGGKGQIWPNGSVVLPSIFQDLDIVPFNSTRRIYLKQNDLYGIADLEGHILIPPAFSPIQFCRPNHWLAFTQDSAYVFDAKGQKTSAYHRDDCRPELRQEYLMLKKGGRWGIQDAAGRALTPFAYDRIESHWDVVTFFDSTSTMTRLWDGTKFQDIGPGRAEVPPAFGPLILLCDRGKWGIVRRSGQVVLPMEYDQIISNYQGANAVRKGNVCHFLNMESKPVFAFQADSLLELVGKQLVFCLRAGRRCLVNPQTGAERISSDSVLVIRGDVVWVPKSGSTGVVLSLRTLREVLPFEVENAHDSYGRKEDWAGLHIFRKAGKAGLVDSSGAVLVPFEMEEILFFSEAKCFWLQKGRGLYGTYHPLGKRLVVLDVSAEGGWWNGKNGYIVEKDTLKGYLNKNLELTIPVEYQALARQPNGTFLARKANLFGAINEKNEVLIPFEYGSLYHNHESQTWVGVKAMPTDIITADGTQYSIPNGCVVSQTKGPWAIVSNNRGYPEERTGLFSLKTGSMVLPLGQKSIRLLEHGFVKVSRASNNSHYATLLYEGLMDSTGRWVIPLDSLQLGGFSEKAIAAHDRRGRCGLFDWTGRIVLPFEWESLIISEEKPIIASKNGQYQMLRPDGTPLTLRPYDYIGGYTYYEHWPARRGKQWGYLNAEGEEATPFKYLFAGHFGNYRLAVVLTDSGYCAISEVGFGVRRKPEEFQYPEVKLHNQMPNQPCQNCLYDSGNRLITKIEGVKLWDSANGLLVFSPDSSTAKAPLKGLMDLSGKMLCPALYDEIDLGQGPLHTFRKDKLWGFIDCEGMVRITPQFDTATPFDGYNRLAMVKKGERIFYINAKGECEKNCP